MFSLGDKVQVIKIDPVPSLVGVLMRVYRHTGEGTISSYLKTINGVQWYVIRQGDTLAAYSESELELLTEE